MAHKDDTYSESTETPHSSGHPYEVKKRADGRWIVVYGKGFPQEGKVWKGTSDYATREEALDAVRGQGTQRGMFDRFLLEREPEPVEWPDDTDADEPEQDEEDGDSEEGMLASLKADAMHKGATVIVLILNSDGMLRRAKGKV